MKLYTMKMADNWNIDYVRVCATLKDVADEIYDLLVNECIYTTSKKELLASLKEREASRCIELLDWDDVPEHWGLSVSKTTLRKA